MVEIPHLVTDVIGIVASAGIISGIAALAEDTIKFSAKKFLYTIGIVGLTSLAIVVPVGGFTEANALQLFFEVAGASLLGNKLLSVATKLRV